ncbi:MAG TPA: hypothetical protein VKB47_16080 [Terracidiphilus sp.]|jgi:hypothetical protein|nr:hypothetical protein [Terracidiphilus sp.]
MNDLDRVRRGRVRWITRAFVGTEQVFFFLSLGELERVEVDSSFS